MREGTPPHSAAHFSFTPASLSFHFHAVLLNLLLLLLPPLLACNQERDPNLRPGFEKRSMWGQLDTHIKQQQEDGSDTPAADQQQR